MVRMLYDIMVFLWCFVVFLCQYFDNFSSLLVGRRYVKKNKNKSQSYGLCCY